MVFKTFLDSHPTRTNCHAFGIETPWKFGSAIFSGVKFYNYDTDHKDCYGIDYCYSSYPFDCGRISHWDRVTWNNSPRKGKFDWEFETVLWDIDGSLSETGQANSKVRFHKRRFDWPISLSTRSEAIKVDEIPGLNGFRVLFWPLVT